MFAVHAGGERWAALKIPAYPFLGERAARSGPDAAAVGLGVVCHLAVSSTWGILFGLLVSGLSRGATVALGLLWGLVVWVVMFWLVLPVVAAPLAEGGGSIGTVIIHLLFGLGVGGGLLPFQPPEIGTWSWRHDRANRGPG
jgi:hypothetical protein